MKDADEYVLVLGELGLGITEARVYVTLAKAEVLSVKEIAEISGVARPEVYGALYKLEKVGLVEILLGESMHFEAVPIDECFSTLLLNRVRKTAELKEKTLELTRNFKRDLQEREVDEEFQFVLIPQKGAVYAKAQKMISEVQDCICFLGLTRRMISWLSSYSSSLEEALARKVDCRMIMPDPGKNKVFWQTIKVFGKYPGFGLRLIPEPSKTAFSVWDRKEILMTTSTIDSATPAPTLWSNNENIVDLCQEHFEHMWLKAEKTSLNKE